MIASTIGLLGATLLATFSYYTTRTFVAHTNYTEMGLLSSLALDDMSRTIRQARMVTACASNSITLLSENGTSIKYQFDPSSHTLTRVSAGQTKRYLSDCDTLRFWIYQRTPKSNSFDCYDPAYVTNAKLVQLTWTCSRKILGASVNSEAVESAKICLRNH